MPMHDCLANTIHNIESAKEDFVLTVKALRTIKEGEPITISYTCRALTTILERQTDAAFKSFVVIIHRSSCLFKKGHFSNYQKGCENSMVAKMSLF
jgi:hypothetical protein